MVKNIVIVGGGSAGWMSAAHMSQHLEGIKITLIESPDIPVIGVGESTVPPMADFMQGLGLEEKDWMPHCHATYKSSICFTNFHDTDGKTMWFPFSSSWQAANRPANRFWLYKHFTDPAYADRFSVYDYTTLIPELCKAGKTVRAIPGAAYAYHFDAGLLGEFLKDFSVKNGVELVSDNVTNVVQNEDGSILKLERKNGEPLEADLFIDCTGFRSLLLGQALGEPFDEYYDYLFNDSAVAMRFPFEDKAREMVSYTQCTGLSSGWVWEIPLYNRMGSGYVYCSKYLSKDQAEEEIRNHLGADRVKDIEARHLKIKVGKHQRTWVKNVVGIGLSCGFVEPLESTGLQIIQGEVDLLTRTLKGSHDYNSGDMAVFNLSLGRLMDVIRDFLIIHFALTSREDTPYWRDVKYNTRIPDSLANKLMIARNDMPSLGSAHIYDTGTLAGFAFNEGWYSILTGMGHLPFDFEKQREIKIGSWERHIQDNMTAADQISRQLDEQRKNIPQMQSHYQYLKEHIYGGAD